MDELGIWDCAECVLSVLPPAGAAGGATAAPAQLLGEAPMAGAAARAGGCGGSSSARRWDTGSILREAGSPPPQRSLPAQHRGSAAEPCSVFNPSETRLKSAWPRALGSG